LALIVNADDFGKSESVNAAICEAFEKGIIDRTTLMTNMPFAADAMKLAKEKRFADRVGIHINLTSGIPLTGAMKTDCIMCGEDGAFTGNFARSLKTRFSLPKEAREHVRDEMRAQLDMYKELGGTLWHVDSHHHVHTDPSIWCELKRVMKDYPVTSVRLSRNMYSGGRALMRLYKMLFNRAVRMCCKGRPEYFGSAEDYFRFLKDHPGLVEKHEVEVMVHPVYDDEGRLMDAVREGFCELKALKRA
jgi:predicted glycoside hydrolase/deacetylase ChbG (UPF0249 family)